MIFANTIEGATHLDQRTSLHAWENNEMGYSLLHIACINNNMNAILALLRAGHNIDSKTIDGKTALIMAAYLDNNDIVQFLISNGANPNLKDVHGKGVIDYMAKNLDTPAEFLILWRNPA